MVFNEEQFGRVQAASTVASDLLHIQSIIGDHALKSRTHQLEVNDKQSHEDSISSSDDNDDSSESEAEIEASLALDPEEKTEPSNSLLPVSTSSDSSDETSSSSDSLSEGEGDLTLPHPVNFTEQFDDDEDLVGTSNSTTCVRTKNEVVDPSVVFPDFTTVGPEEKLEMIGEVMSIVDNVVIVKGLSSPIADRASESALDTDSLLVFDDRCVLGFIYETFGPTHQPLYQVKFGPSFPLDRDLVRISRPVFHVPSRSKFIFASYLKKLKGSDASNVHDEEIAEDEAEFSDDEAELAYKRSKRRNLDRRSTSILSSRFDTHIPSQMRDQDMTDDSPYGISPYDEHGPYDLEYEPGPSRPLPMPYDDPYRSIKVSTIMDQGVEASKPFAGDDYCPTFDEDLRNTAQRSRNRNNNRGVGRGGRRDRGRSQRGRGRGRATSHTRLSGQQLQRQESQYKQDTNMHSTTSQSNNESEIQNHSISPTSDPIAHATNNYNLEDSYSSSQQTQSVLPVQSQPSNWLYQNYQNTQNSSPSFQSGNSYQPYVQPHINPRFANLFGLNMNFATNSRPPYNFQANGFSPYSPSFPPGHDTTAYDSRRGRQASSSRIEEYEVPMHPNGYGL